MVALTFLSDFGNGSHYTASFKGALLKAGVDMPLIEINNQVDNNEISESAYLSSMVFDDFPKNSIHILSIGIVAHTYDFHLIAKYKGHYFIAANNAILSLIFGMKFESYFVIPNLSKHFSIHDLYIPVIKKILSGYQLSDFLVPAQNVKKQTLLKPGYVDGELIGSVLFIDNIGNVYTNISRQDFTSFFEGNPFIIKLSRHYNLDKISDELINIKPGDIYGYFSEHGYLVIAIREGSAEKLLNLRKYKPIIIQKR
ncbi:MAG: SAM-dependent chlorinase/fluorinase [Bacteroidia bacterium]|nr:SAM-dependent chlorinase/fluorinase [Bacteroidia bacterium]